MKKKRKPTVVSILKFESLSEELKEVKRNLKSRKMKIKDKVSKLDTNEPSFQWDF